MRCWVAIFILFFSSQISANGVVVAEKKLAAEIGAKILRQGGNAIDAAVAVGYALAVIDPCCGNLGGGGFMTIHLANGENSFINFRERAPLAASPTLFQGASPNATTEGYLAVATPGTVLGLNTALIRYGTLTLDKVISPAIDLAEHGFIVSSADAAQFAAENVFTSYKAGDKLIQADLATTLKLIASEGTNVFYKGPIAQAIVTASNENHGILSMKDFEDYSVQITDPIKCDYRGYQIITAAPPSSGGITLCEMLNILENFHLTHTAHSSQLIIEGMRYAYLDRNAKLGDPDFVTNPTEELLSKVYAKQISNEIASTFNVKVTSSNTKAESMHTTHYSIIDREGNAVAVTYTLNGYFGAKVMAPGTGFFLNNEMDDFATTPGKANNFGLVQYEQNAVAGGKRPLSSMTPTIILKDNKVFAILGSPGGPRIITSVLQTIINLIDYGFPLQAAIDEPRIHYQSSPDIISSEKYALSPYSTLYLKMLGYSVKEEADWSAVSAILSMENPKGASDRRRRDGAAVNQ